MPAPLTPAHLRALERLSHDMPRQPSDWRLDPAMSDLTGIGWAWGTARSGWRLTPAGRRAWREMRSGGGPRAAG